MRGQSLVFSVSKGAVDMAKIELLALDRTDWNAWQKIRPVAKQTLILFDRTA